MQRMRSQMAADLSTLLTVDCDSGNLWIGEERSLSSNRSADDAPDVRRGRSNQIPHGRSMMTGED